MYPFFPDAASFHRLFLCTQALRHHRRLSLRRLSRRLSPLHIPQPTPQGLHPKYRRRHSPQAEAKRREPDVHARRLAHRAAAEQQFREEDGQRDEAREVEDGCCELERNVREGVGTLAGVRPKNIDGRGRRNGREGVLPRGHWRGTISR